MKFSIVVLVLAVVAAQTVYAEEDETAVSSDTGGDEKEAAAIIDGTPSEYVQKSVSEFYTSASSLSTSLSTDITTVKNSVKRTTLYEALDVLEQIGSSSTSFQKSLKSVGTLVTTGVDEEQNVILDSWNTWSAAQTIRVSNATNDDGDKQEEAEDILKDFIKRYKATLSTCSTQVKTSLQDYEATVQDNVSRYDSSIPALTREINTCINGANTSAAANKCRSNVRSKLSPLKAAPSNLDRLNKQGRALAVDSFENSACAVRAQSRFETEKTSIIRRLNTIINRET